MDYGGAPLIMPGSSRIFPPENIKKKKIKKKKLSEGDVGGEGRIGESHPLKEQNAFCVHVI